MTIQLNHLIVPAHDKEESARFYARLFGFEYMTALGYHFAPVKIPSQSLTFDFDNRTDFPAEHYAFKVSEAEFDDIFGRIVDGHIVYGSLPWASDDMQLYHQGGGRGLYFKDPNGHMLELLTQDYTVEHLAEMAELAKNL